MTCPQKPTTVLNPLPCDTKEPGSCFNFLADPSRTQKEIDQLGENLLFLSSTSDLVTFCRRFNDKCSAFLTKSCSACKRTDVISPNDLGALCGCFIETDPCDSVCSRGDFTVKKKNQTQCNFGGACIIDNVTIGSSPGGHVEQSCDCATCECIVDRDIVDDVGFVQKCASQKCFIREIDGSMTLVPCATGGDEWSLRKKSMFIAITSIVGLAIAFVVMSLFS